MIHGNGTDIIKIDRLEMFVDHFDDPFIKKTYTENELKLIASREIPLNSLATRFAGKEAVFKSLGIEGNAIRLNEIEILETETGQPVVTLFGKAKLLADQFGITKIFVSLSYDTDYAIAFATAESE